MPYARARSAAAPGLRCRAAARSRSRLGSTARSPGAITTGARPARRRRDRARRRLALIGRQRQIGAVRQPHHAQLDVLMRRSRRALPRCGRPARAPPRPSTAAARISTPVGGDEVHGVAVAAHDAGSRRHVVGDDPVAALALRASPWHARSTFSVSAAKPITSLGRLVLRLRDRGQDVGIFRSASCGGPPPSFLILLAVGCGDAPVGDRGGEHRRRRPAAPSRRRSASRARFRPADRRRRRDRAALTGPGHQRHLGARRGRRRARSRSPACRRSGWRCSAPDRSAHASAPR